jgi:outer membrane protein|tara:strand:+ start:146 stop:667 length:522 start_codon:yes stop_codon:yes gene_type:complete
MKRLFLSVFTIIALFTNFAFCEEKISFIDMDKVISTSNSGLSILEQLNELNKKNITFYKKEEKIFKEKEVKLISQKNIISETDFENKVNQLKSEINDYNQNKNKMINKFNRLKVDNTKKLLNLINPILVKFSQDNSIDFILQKKNLIIGKTELDITDEVIKIVNKEISKFKIE